MSTRAVFAFGAGLIRLVCVRAHFGSHQQDDAFL